MRTNQIYIARDGKSGMHVLVRILAIDDIGRDYLPIDPDDFNKLMMARDAKSLVLAAHDLGSMYISADSLSGRAFIPSHLQQDIEYGFNLIPRSLSKAASLFPVNVAILYPFSVVCGKNYRISVIIDNALGHVRGVTPLFLSKPS